jgi:hypothetical protein
LPFWIVARIVVRPRAEAAILLAVSRRDLEHAVAIDQSVRQFVRDMVTAIHVSDGGCERAAPHALRTIERGEGLKARDGRAADAISFAWSFFLLHGGLTFAPVAV